MAKEVVIEESEQENTEQKTEKPKEDSNKEKGKTSWKRIVIGLGVVIAGNVYSYLTAYSMRIFFDMNTVVGLLAIIFGLYIILK